MNFMKDNHPFKKSPSRWKKKTINFFQTVREGKRNFTAGIIDKDNSTSGIPWVRGRRFIQPYRRTTSSSRTGTDVRTILSSLEQQSNFGSSAVEDKFSNGFSGSSLEQSVNKRHKSLANVTTSYATKEISSSSGLNHISSMECLSPFFSNSREEVSSSRKKGQQSSVSNCDDGAEKFLSSPLKQSTSAKRNDNLSYFNLQDPSGLNKNAFTGTFFKTSSENQKCGTPNKEFFTNKNKNLQLQKSSAESFFEESQCDHETQDTSDRPGEGLFKKSKKHLASKEVFIKTPLIQSPKSIYNEGFFQLPGIPFLKNTCNVEFSQGAGPEPMKNSRSEEFFKVPATKPHANQRLLRTSTIQSQKTSTENFFKTTKLDSRRSSSKECFDLNVFQTLMSTSNDNFFKIPVKQSDKTDPIENFFKTSKSQNETNFMFPEGNNRNNPPAYSELSAEQNVHSRVSLGYEELFKTPIQPKPSTSSEPFFQTQTTEPLKTLSNDMFKTPVKRPGKTPRNEANLRKPPTQSQKTPSYGEFLKPQLNPKLFTTQNTSKMANSTSSSTGNYESLFTTPSKVTSLPKMTTPYLFQPFEKQQSKTTATPVSKTNSKTNSKTLNITNEDSTYFVISVTEGRGCAICEIGLAAIDLKSPTLILSQFSDVPTYKKLLAKINLMDAAELLMPETFSNVNPSEMYKKVTETFMEVRVTTAKRVQFSAKNGLESIRQLMLADDSSIEVIVCKKYYALAAAEALLRYIEIKHNVLFSPKTLQVNFESAKDSVALDLESCQRLELVTSSASVLFPEQYSLFGVLNFTKTIGGKRRLRCNLMQPSSSQEQLEKRLHSVSALVNNQTALSSLQTCLLKFSNVERILWLCKKTPNFRNESNTFDTLTNYILLLKGCLEGVPHLRKVLEDIDEDNIINIRNDLHDDSYELMLNHIKKMIRDDARLTKGYASSSRERCFAIKEGFNDLLDLARATYSELIEHVLKMVTELAEEFCLPLKMTQTVDFGFHASYVLPKNISFKKDDVPDIFTEVKTKNRTVHLLTDEMFNLNVRINRAMEEIQLITNLVIFDLVESLKEGMSYLYRLCDRVAELDLISSLAQVSSTPDYTKPIFGSQICLVGARHPILDHLCPTKPIPNNFNASRKSNFTIVTGPNMSGKTVYVLTVPLIQIMAQVGCYVPADKAELRITDHIYVRKGASDNMPCKLSSHGTEMKELSYTLKTLTDRSLIVLDELCTSCSCQKGICLAWAFSEEFLKTSCFTFLTTHYHYLCNLSKVYRNVKNFHMESIEKTPNPGESEWDMTFTFRLLPGKTQMTDYALRLMMASALPNEVKQYAMAVAKDIAHRRETSLPVCLVDEPDRIEELVKIEKIENFISNLNSLCKTDKFTPKIFRALQKMIREEILSDIESDEDISNEEADKTISTPEEHNNIVVEVQKIVDEAVDEFLKGEEEDKVLKRNNQFVLTQSSGREEESLSSGKCNSAVNMGIDKNMIHSDREGNEIQLFSNLGHQESEEENDDHYNENVMDSRLNESKQLPTLDDVRPVLNKKSPESDDEKADNNILYLKRKESQDLKNNMLTEDHGEYSGEEDCEGRNDNVLYPERNKLQNFMDIEDRSFPTDDQVDYNEQEESYNIEYLEKQPTPNSTAINVNRPTQDILLGNREDVNAHYSVTSQECSNRFTPEDFTGSQDNEFKYYREHSETEGNSSSSSEGSYYIHNNLT